MSRNGATPTERAKTMTKTLTEITNIESLLGYEIVRRLGRSKIAEIVGAVWSQQAWLDDEEMTAEIVDCCRYTHDFMVQWGIVAKEPVFAPGSWD